MTIYTGSQSAKTTGNYKLDENANKDYNVSYWQRQLAGLTPEVNLFSDHSPSSKKTYNALALHFSFSAELKEQINLVSDQLNSTPFTVLLAAFKTILYRYTDQEDIIIAAPLPAPHLAKEVGATGKPDILLLRTCLSENPTFSELVARVSTVFADAVANNIPYKDLLDISRNNNDFKRNSLFSTMFSFDDEIVFGQKSHVINHPDLDTYQDYSNLTLSVINTNEGFTGQFIYNSQIYKPDEIIQVLKHYQVLLQSVVTDPYQEIGTVSILTPEEKHTVLYEWNNTKTKFGADKCLNELFEDQVKLTPDAIAVKLYQNSKSVADVDKFTWTYAEVNNKANKLARYLQSLGVGPEVLVGICIERSVELVVGILAILKSSGAYVPIDAKYPKQRISFILKDAAVSVLLTQEKLVGQLPQNNAKIVCLDTGWSAIAKNSCESVVCEATPDNLAYVIYTSGSKGTPKGALITHRGVANYLQWSVREYEVTKGCGAPVNSSISFDATITAFFSPLIAGRYILLLPELGEIEALANVLSSNNYFSLIKITPAHLEMLRHMLPQQNLGEQANAIVIGGDALFGESLSAFQINGGSTKIINEYGPTETVVGCCTYAVSNNAPIPSVVPIGRPISNTQIYILNKYLQPVPPGVSGEIFIGGAGVARGYLNQPELTEEKFISNPFSNHPGARLYKTGDLGRYLEDGNIVFLGRKDDQVKINGYRIELGEVELAVRQYPAIDDAVVIVAEDDAGEKRLCAFFVSRNRQLPIRLLRQFLQEKLPKYMIPSSYVWLQSLPLTSNGKVDKKALPAPKFEVRQSDENIVKPRDAVEQKLAKIFKQNLGINAVSIEDDFFELGGSSIKAAQMFNDIKKAFRKKLPLSTLLVAPSIEKLSVYLRKNGKFKAWSCLVPIQPLGTKPPLFCIHGGWGNVLFYRYLSNSLGAQQPLYALQAQGLDGKGFPHGSIERMAADYIRELRSVQNSGPYHLAGYCFGAVVAFEMAQQLKRQGQEVALLVSFNGVTPNYIEPVIEDVSVNKMTDRNSSRGFYGRLIKFKKKFLQMNTRDKFLYPFVRIRFAWSQVATKVNLALYLKYRNLGWRLPAKAARLFVASSMNNCLIKYSPKPYDGNMTVFRSPKLYSEATLGWKEFVNGEIVCIEVPGEHQNRTYIMYEPHVQFIAAKLQQHNI
jgi:amino acid adenylation domain-containing protein